MKFFIPILQKILIKRISGVEHIPNYGPFIVVSNHQSHLDGFLLASYVIQKTNQPIHFLAKEEFTSYFGRWIEEIIYKRWGNCILVEKEGTKGKGKFAIAQAAVILEDEGIVGIFPEGTRTYDGSILEGRTGVVRIILEAQKHTKRKIPLIPIGVVGANILLPRKKIIPRVWKKRASIKVGKAFYINITKNDVKGQLRRETTLIMKKIAACAGEKYDP